MSQHLFNNNVLNNIMIEDKGSYKHVLQSQKKQTNKQTNFLLDQDNGTDVTSP